MSAKHAAERLEAPSDLRLLHEHSERRVDRFLLRAHPEITLGKLGLAPIELEVLPSTHADAVHAGKRWRYFLTGYEPRR